jgi:hypothetical protein
VEQAKINDRGVAAVAYNVLLREGVTLGVGASFDTQKLDQATHKVRLTSVRLSDQDANTPTRSALASPSSRKLLPLARQAVAACVGDELRDRSEIALGGPDSADDGVVSNLELALTTDMLHCIVDS